MTMTLLTALMVFCSSCTKVSEKTFVGTWKVISLQIDFHDGYGWFESEYEDWTISFYEGGSYTSTRDGDKDYGNWGYISSTNQLKFYGVLWDVSRFDKKEIRLSSESNGISEQMYLRKK